MKNKENRIERKRKLTGVVKSNKMESTVKVVVERPVRHPVYRKIVSRRKAFMAHTKEDLQIGDTVVIREIAPRSKNVRWEVIEKVEEK